jgi:hypothetical protein
MNPNFLIMKKFTLFLLVICIPAMAMAHSKYAKAPLHSFPANSIKNQIMPAQPGNPLTNTKAALEDLLGSTIYDMQTNATIQNRMYVYPDGSMVGTWTRGTEVSSQRGTGYNYFNGTSWGEPPTGRIETRRAGWPSYAPWGANGEIVVTHDDILGLLICKRPNKGTGAWTQSVLAGPAGAVDISWPRMITNGPTNNNVHIIATTYSGYQGLDENYALLYYRSLDGGVTWDRKDIILPGMDSTNYDGFSGDEYAWGTSFGDTIYFAVSGTWTDTFIMKSTDNGNTWTKTPVLSNAYKKLPSTVLDLPDFRSSDGSVAVEMDHNGVMHIAFGVGGGYLSGGGKYVYSNMNGLVYWNSTMPMVTDSLDLDTLAAHGQLLGAVYDGPDPGDTIIDVPNYKVGLSSFPQISIDEWNNVYFLWSAATPGNPSPDPYNFRHIWGRAKFHDKSQMSEMIDFNSGIFYAFYEYVYPSMAKNILNDKLSFIYQTAGEPGSNVADSNIPIHECNIEYREIPGSAFWTSGMDKKQAAISDPVTQNFPNPVKGTTWFNVNLDKAATVVVEVSNLTGQKIMSLDKGVVNAGLQTYSIDCRQFAAGVYFYTVRINGIAYTHKMIVG